VDPIRNPTLFELEKMEEALAEKRRDAVAAVNNKSRRSLYLIRLGSEKIRDRITLCPQFYSA
jgi:hypothetical protein